jgi:hypothetical protein
MVIVRIFMYLLAFAFAAIFLALFGVPIVIWRLLRIVWFRCTNRGQRFLVYTHRHGWSEFVSNNLIPAIGREFDAVAIPRGGRLPWPRRLGEIHAATFGQPKPLVAEIWLLGVRCIPLHELLLPLKHHGARSQEIQADLREILDRLMPCANRR